MVAIALFGSAANPPWKEVPRFRGYRRAGIAPWRECADVDIVVWLSRSDRLREMRWRVDHTLPVILDDTGTGVASHHLDLFVLEPGTDHYLGRMCRFRACPANKSKCLVPGCGATALAGGAVDLPSPPKDDML